MPVTHFIPLTWQQTKQTDLPNRPSNNRTHIFFPFVFKKSAFEVCACAGGGNDPGLQSRWMYLLPSCTFCKYCTSTHAPLQYYQSVTAPKGQRLLHTPKGSRFRRDRAGRLSTPCIRFRFLTVFISSKLTVHWFFEQTQHRTSTFTPTLFCYRAVAYMYPRMCPQILHLIPCLCTISAVLLSS